MFEKTLATICTRVFCPQVTYDAWDYEAPEQDKLFIEVTEAVPRISHAGGGKALCRVKGNFVFFSQGTRLPYGFFAKQVAAAAQVDVAGLFIEREVDVADSPARMVNIHERRCGFLFLFETQFDPDQGSLTSMEIT